MPGRRKYNNTKRAKSALVRKYKSTPRHANEAASTIQAAVRRALAKNIETKQSNTSTTDNQDIAHNSFVNVDTNVLSTTQGVTDPTNNSTANRIGDEINLKGVSFKIMLENNNRYPDTTFRILVVKSAKGDTPTTASLFTGLSGNKMMDTINNERHTVLFSKYVKVKAGNVGGDGALGVGYVGSGLYSGNNSLLLSASTKIVKFWIPGSKFVRGGKIRYENGTSQCKFFDYNVLVYAYSVYGTSEALEWTVGKVNEYLKVMYYKDA